jgi:hypothetical protein
MADLKRRNEKALIGWDFPLGYPAGTAAMLNVNPPDWSGLWKFLSQNVVDKPTNVNNRFAVAAKMNRLMTDEARPFWGAPANDTQRWLASTKPEHADDLPAPFRHCEQATKGKGKAGAKTVWQIFGNGTVGSQAIVGIPHVRQLRETLGDRAKVWPFETGWKALSPDDVADLDAVIVEIYPALGEVKPEPGEVPDRAQVRAQCEYFARLDEAGKLGDLFAAPKGLSAETISDVQREEGWILGA